MSDVLARAEIAITANTSGFDKAMDALPAKAQAKIKKSVDAINAEMAQVGQALGQAKNLGEVKTLTEYYAKLKQALDAVKMSAISQAQAIGTANQAMAGAAAASKSAMGGFKNLGTGVLFVSQAIEDAQYGFSAIVNNIPGIVMAFGGSAGLAGGISIASVGINLLIKNWDHLKDAMGAGHIRTAAEQMEELGKKTEKTAEEMAKLAKYQRDQQNVKAQAESQTEKQTHQQTEVNKAVAESPFENFNKLVRDMVRPAARNSVPDADKIDEIRKSAERPTVAGTDRLTVQRRIQEIEDAIAKRVEELAKQMMIDIGTRPEALKGFVQRLKDQGAPKTLVDRFEEAAKSPEDANADKKNREFEAESARKESARRLAKIQEEKDLEALDAKEVMESNSQRAKYDEDRRVDQLNRDQAKVAPLEDKIIPSLLEKIARGEEINQEKLQHIIEDKIAGLGIKDPASVAANLASKTVEDLNAKLAKRKLENGGTIQDAAVAESAERLARMKAQLQANRPSYGVTDIESFHKEAQDALLRGSSSEALQAETKRLADATEKATAAQVALEKAFRESKGGLRLMPP